MNSRSIAPILALVVALPVALWLGVSVAQDQITAVLWTAGALFFCLCLALGRHVWILIPATVGMQGTINALPGSPDVWALMTLAAGAFTLARIAVRRQKLNIRWSGMETALLLVALTILQAAIRNPVGVSILGGEVAGGKPYFQFLFAFAAFLCIATADADLRSWRWAVIALITGSLLDCAISILGETSATFAKFAIRFYSNVSFDVSRAQSAMTDIDNVRLGSLSRVGGIFGLIACTFWRPLASLELAKPWRSLVALGAVVLIFLGGGRGGVARLLANFVVGSLLRKRYLDLLVGGMAGILLLAGLIGLAPTDQLPYSVQRVLTAVPGINLKLRSDVEHDAEHSSEIRFEMWRLALSSNKYIDNRLLGDGFQISRKELAARQALLVGDYRTGGQMDTIDMFMATGSYHGFHAETIRFTGVVGLTAATAALIVFSVFAMRCIRLHKGTRHWGFVLYVCMPFLIHWWWFWLVFGSYREQYPAIIVTAGVIKLLWVMQAKEGDKSQRLETGSAA
jgi:hypothetical protein